jgi:hypothetical protein
MVDMWYNEINDYNFNNPGFNMNGLMTGHFTQCVWKATNQVGCGIGVIGFSIYGVCQFSPAGNFFTTGLMAENFTANVAQPFC